MEQKLLTREQFREQCLIRDNYTCVFCSEKNDIVVHHIIERRIFGDGGYYLNNGASVCAEHHMKCESTEISLQQVREACGIVKAVLPPHFYHDQEYDKWGNVIMPNGQRLKGELFFDESVQKVIKNYLPLFTDWVKYPRTYHLPWSEGMHDDDRMMQSLDEFYGRRVIVTEKLDGENSTLYRDYFHARSVDGRHHSSRDWVKGFWSQISGDIPEGWRVCGENLFAKHSIGYDNLDTYFYGFSIWNERNVCLSWDETNEYFNLMGITSVPVLYDGQYDEKTVRRLWNQSNYNNVEGYVMRVADEIPYGQFKQKVGKFVRKGHIMTAKHWMFGQAIEKNLLKESR